MDEESSDLEEERIFRFIKPDAIEDGEKIVKEIVFPIYFDTHYHSLVFENPKSIISALREAEDFLTEMTDDEHWKMLQNKTGRQKEQIEKEYRILNQEVEDIKQFNGISFLFVKPFELKGDFLGDMIRLDELKIVNDNVLLVLTSKESHEIDVK